MVAYHVVKCKPSYQAYGDTIDDNFGYLISSVRCDDKLLVIAVIDLDLPFRFYGTPGPAVAAIVYVFIVKFAVTDLF